MFEEFKNLWRRFYNWTVGNGPRPENEVIPPEPPPDLPFTRRLELKRSRFQERPLASRYNEWLERKSLHVFSMLYLGMSILTCLLFMALLLSTVAELPSFGDANNPVNNEVIKRYIEKGGQETGAQNIVAGMILDYRAFDTFGESAVLFTAAISVLMLLGAVRRADTEEISIDLNNASDGILRRGPPSLNLKITTGFTPRIHMFRKNDAILRGVAVLSIPAIILLGLTVIINGHLSPGGGFSGGAILSVALMLCANAYGFEQVHAFFDEHVFIRLSSLALMIYAVLKGWSFFSGANHIESGIPTGTIGEILSGGLILPLNICVGLIVAGTLYGFYALFSEGEI
ncbi:MAG: hypothetical protein IJ520_12470 [Synergistaceae bacterium]|nr:hypothetical protein [Synergistaceae bacterium]